jgi:glutamate-ammonia-ligase adenylyltransferase
VDFLLHQAARRGEMALSDPETPSIDSGLIVLGMGKLGARELNYSSDIDLILLFDREQCGYRGEAIQPFMSKLAHELVRMLQERTAEGYVFRTDLRLRPDPASTPPAMSVNAAMVYYETVGQNWERAALIKARPVAGDLAAAERFLSAITPFIWRKYLDFAAIADIQSIKRQMDSRGSGGIHIEGHNIKTGEGGIREIEFFVQIHQLIWGGRKPSLRGRRTCDMLEQLAREGLIESGVAQRLAEAYRFYRLIEHRLQMSNDQQTHTLPESAEAIAALAQFCGMQDADTFRAQLLAQLRYVHGIFRDSFRGPGELGVEGKLSFTGVEPDKGTLATLSRLGFVSTPRIYELIAGWHRGTRRATRTKRARELITEVTPALLTALAATVNPDQAFVKFDEFLQKLPAGVQLFSLFANQPKLLSLIATLLGSAPALADALARNPTLLDTVISGAFYRQASDLPALKEALAAHTVHMDAYDPEYAPLRQFRNEQQFFIGVQLLTHRIDVAEAARALSDVCELLLTQLLAHIEAEFARTYGSFGQDALAVIALGRLGARELTFGSDLDLVFVYDDMDEQAFSGGARSFTPNIYFARLCQRFIGALTALSPQGRLYEVDTRLRPSGAQGPIAVSLSAFERYFEKDAWTFEYMALTRARVITGNAALRRKLTESIRAQVCKPRDPGKLAADVREMRGKVEQEFGTRNPWNVKYARGGLMDLDFLAQYLVLAHAHRLPALYAPSTGEVLKCAAQAGLLEGEAKTALPQAYDLLTPLLFILRLSSHGVMDEQTAPQGQKTLLAESLGLPDFAALRERLLATETVVRREFDAMLE